MKDPVGHLLDHYAIVTDGSSALLREDLLLICREHSLSETEFCLAFSLELARRFVSGALDAERAAFAADDMHSAADYILPPFARRVLDALEYRDHSPQEVGQLLEEHGYGVAA
jgi:hypothetical protein